MSLLRTFWRFVAVAAIAIFGFACNANELQIQAQTANAVAAAANSTLPILVANYRLDGLEAIAQAGTADEAQRGVAAVKAKWAAVWNGWEALRIAEDDWAKAIEQRGALAPSLRALVVAYCALLAVWPDGIPVVPLAPLRCGGTP